MKTIILKFSGPLQSWGIGSNFENRETARYPTKSAVIGLIAGALGYRRDETDKIQELNNLSFGVRIEQKGSLLKDFHIARSSKQVYVTNRYYLQDAAFLVMLSHENSKLIDALGSALNFPFFPLYMGRRSVPVPSDFFQGIKDDNLLGLLKSYDWQASDWYKKKIKKESKSNKVFLDAYVDANLLDDTTPSMFQRDKVESFSLMDRGHSFRPVKAIRVEIQTEEQAIDTDHDIFQMIEGGV